MTQDLSFSPLNPLNAINPRIDIAAYPEMVYGWCLPRIFHLVVAMRHHNPTTRVLIAKYDYSDAYRRMAHMANAAAQTLSVIDNTAFIALRLTFGGSPNPPAWCSVSEIVADLSNEISQMDHWDPSTLYNPDQPNTPTPKILPPDTPMALAHDMAVLPPPTSGRVDVFIDDLINVFLDTVANRAKQPHVVPLAAYITNRPHAGDANEPIPRRPILSIPKLIAEGTPAEIQIVLGWLINTRRLTVALPDDKFLAWKSDVQHIITERRVRHDALDSLLGRFNHAAMIMPITRHFLGRLRALLTTKSEGYHWINIRRSVLDDLELWITLLTKANQGLSLNSLVTRRPNRIVISDSCPYGVGGFNLKGRGWRICIPRFSPLFGNKTINNLLEFIGMAIGVCLEILDDDDNHPCILAIGDSTSAIGWLHNTSRLLPSEPCHAAHLFVARLLATSIVNSGACLASQHIKGTENVVADLLSYAAIARDGKPHPIAMDNPTDFELTQRFHKFLQPQIPADFNISNLPPSILSWVTQALQIAESSLIPNKKRVTKLATEHGNGGSDFVPKPTYKLTPSSLLYPQENGPSSAKPFSPASDPQRGLSTVPLWAQVRSQYSLALSKKPQATWLRRSGAVTSPAPCTTKVAPTSTP